MDPGEERIRRRDRFGIQGELAGDGLEGVEHLTAVRTAENVLGQEPVGLGGIARPKGSGARIRPGAPAPPAWRSITLHPQCRAKLPHRRERPRLDGPERDLQLLRDLHLGLPIEVGHLEHLPLFGREADECLSDLFPAHAEVRLLGDGVRRVFADQGFEVRRALGPRSQAGFPPDQVDRPVVHEREEEGSEGSACRVVRLGRSPEGHEGIVDDVLSQDLLSGHAVGEPVGRSRRMRR